MSFDGAFDVAVLAGGRSSRMGFDKAFLKIDGEALLDRQLALAWSLSPAEVWVIGRAQAAVPGLHGRAVPDEVPGEGPLGGLATALRSTRAEHVLLLAVDMPALTAGFLRQLLGERSGGVGVVPRLRSRWEPLVAVYPRSLAAPARAALARGRRSMREFAEASRAAGRVLALDVDPRHEALLVNWNAPSDLGGVAAARGRPPG